MKNLTKHILLACLILSNYISQGQVTSTWFSSPTSYAIDNIVPEGEAVVHQLNLLIASGTGCQYTYEYSRFPGAINSASGYNGLNSVQAAVVWNHASTATITFYVSGCNDSQANSSYSKSYPILNIPDNISGTNNLSCGTQNATYSVPSVANANSYEWTYPSGWTVSGSSTSNSITLQANVNGGGNINVKAINGSAKTSSNTIAVTRPQFTSPTISNYGTLQGVNSGGYLDRVLCGTTTIEVTGGNGTSYDWQTTGGVSANSTTSTASISASSDGTIKVYPVSACGSAVGTENYALINIKTGTPGTPTFLADGDGNSFVNMCSGNSKYLVVNSDRESRFF